MNIVYALWFESNRGSGPTAEQKRNTRAELYYRVLPEVVPDVRYRKCVGPIIIAGRPDVDNATTPVHIAVVCRDCYYHNNYLVMSYKIAFGLNRSSRLQLVGIVVLYTRVYIAYFDADDA